METRTISRQRPMSRACFEPSTWQPGNPPHYTALLIRLTRLRSGGMTALWCGAQKWISRQSGGASIRRGLTLSSSSFIPALGSLSLACSKAIVSPAGLRVLAAISQEPPTSAVPST
jgi:hypothetical protein